MNYEEPEPWIDLDEPKAKEKRDWLGPLRGRFVLLALGLILLLGAVFRFTGVNWDDYQHLHPDERFLTMVETGIRWPGDPELKQDLIENPKLLPPGCTGWGGYFDTACSPLNPYNRGFSSFVYGTFPLFLVKLVGDWIGQAGYDQIHLVGRYLSGLFDLSTVLLIFLIGRRLFGSRVGLLAALLLSASVLDLQQSHFFTVDTFANVPLLIAFWFTLDIAEGKRGWVAYALAGLFLGLALAARINLLAFFGILGLAVVYRFASVLSKTRDEASVEPRPARPERTFAFQAGSVAEANEAGEQASAEGPSVRHLRLGPLAIDVEAQRRSRGEPGAVVAEASEREGPAWWEEAALALFGLCIAGVAAFVAFRIFQPYAFKGWGLNPQFLADMNFARDLVAGNVDMPPMDQWTARPDYWFPFVNMVMWGLGPGLGLAGTAGFLLAGFELAFRRAWSHLLTFFWVGGLFFYLGQQVAKTDRYFLPLYPFVALFAAYFIIRLWNRARARTYIADARGRLDSLRALIRPPTVLAGLVLIAAVGSTLFWAAAFTSIYTRPVTRVTASRWIYQNVPRGATLGNEHWDDPLPLRLDGMDAFGGFYRGVELQWYGEDTPEKQAQAIEWLDQADYINLTSNRLYESIPRLPVRYPLTTKYYEWLFNGKLGFQLVETVTSRPSFLGITINDDDAEESFTVYDHPKVLIFKKTPAYSHDNTAALLNSVDLTDVIRQKPIDATQSHQAFQLPTAEKQAEYSGGTWSQIFNPDDLVNRAPVIVWIVLLEVLGLVLFPFSFMLFRRFADRGYGLSKALGVLALGWSAWTLASYHVLPFSRESILLVLATLVLVAALIAWRHREEMAGFLREQALVVLVEELVFFGFFFISLLIRYGNPDLWHPNFGGEKPMDFAYLDAIIKTTWFPPYNPWFEGGYINYYYFGQVLSATLVKFTGIVPEVAYNLLLPMFFSLTALGAFVTALNLTAAIRSNGKAPQETGEQVQEARRPVVDGRAMAAGLFAAFLVLVVGNLREVGVLSGALTSLGAQSRGLAPGQGGIFSLLAGIGAWLIGRQPFPISIGDWYWTATRVIPDTINEFPFFTFLYADLHAHLMALAYTLVALAFAVHAVLLRGRLRWYDLGAAALVLGSLRAINTWDLPTYMAAVGAAIVIGYLCGPSVAKLTPAARWTGYLSAAVLVFVQVLLAVMPVNALGVKLTIDILIYGLVLIFGLTFGWVRFGLAFSPRGLVSFVGWRMIALVVLSAVLYYPFLAFYGAAYTSVEPWKGARTSLTDYLVVWGIFLFIVGTYLVLANRKARPAGQPAGQDSWDWALYGIGGVLFLATFFLLLNLAVFAVVTPFVALAAWLLFRRDSLPEVRLLALLGAAALLMTAMVEVITLKGDVGRMNTVFKFYLQAWVLFSIVGAVGLAQVWERVSPWVRREQAAAGDTAEPIAVESGPVASPAGRFGLKEAWAGALGVLLLAGCLYPVFATWAKVNDRYVPNSPAGLNGLNYMQHASYGEAGHDFPLAPDHDAILWIRENIKGSPVIAEANTGLYRWGDRISINTGLPTVIGWDWHTKQQYALLDGVVVDQRIAELRSFYNNADPNSITAFLKRYDVSYIYIGPLERAVYAPEGLSKFEAMAQSGALDKVYDSGQVQIYRVKTQTALAP